VHFPQLEADRVRASVLWPVTQVLASHGEAGQALLRDFGADPAQLADPYGSVPLARYVALFEAAALLSSESTLGLRLGRELCPTTLGPMGVLAVHQPTLRQALRCMQTYLATLQGGTQLELLEEHTVALFAYQIRNSAIWPRRQDAEFSMAAICTLTRMMLGTQWRPLEVHFEHGDNGNARALQGFLRSGLRFGEAVNRLVFRRADLDNLCRTSAAALPARQLLPFVARDLDFLMRAMPPQDLVERVTTVLHRRLGREEVSLQAIAAELGLSSRTLQRALADRGTSLRTLLRRERERQAASLIQEGWMGGAMIAQELGYADASCFSRAFRTWTGQTARTRRRAPK
jgi:AraC-like DNA-binding protein